MYKYVFSLPALALLAASVAAQQPLEEIVVTGEFRERPLDDVPASISVVQAERIEQRSARHLDEVLALAPNVNLSGGSSRSRFFQIRGVGDRSQFDEPLNPSVGVIVDGVDLSTAAMAATLFDIEQVEVFRGPQGTRYGANALAGLINVRTRAPTETFEARAGLDAGNYDAVTLNGAVSGPLGERIEGRLAAQKHASDGFIENTYLNRDDTNKRDEITLRGKLRWRPSDSVTISSLAGYVDLDNGYDAFSFDNDRDTLSDDPGRDAQETTFAGLEATWDAREAYRLEASASAAVSDSIYGFDEDWVYEGFHPAGYSSVDYYYRDRRSATAELRVLSNEAGRIFGGATDWLAGAYMLEREVDFRRERTFAAGTFTSAFSVDRLAVFGQLDTMLGERTRLTTGVRYERHRSSYADSENVAFAPEDDLTGWRLSIDHLLGDDLMIYGTLARGYKAGGVNAAGTLSPEQRAYAPETLTNLELGLKGRFFDGLLDARIALFDMARDDMQVAQAFQLNPGDPGSEFIQYTGNAAEGMNRGLEAELVFTPTERFELSTSLGLLESEYESYVNVDGDDLSGRAQAHAPEYEFAASGRYEFARDWYVRLGAEGRDAFYFSDDHAQRSESYTLYNAALGFARNDWDVRLWGRNVTDEDRAIRGYYFGNDPRIGYAPRLYTQLGEPRRVGLSVSRSFD